MNKDELKDFCSKEDFKEKSCENLQDQSKKSCENENHRGADCQDVNHKDKSCKSENFKSENGEDKNCESKNCKDESLDEVLKLQNELSQITDKFYRANADFENIKKRMEKEKMSAVSFANESFAKDILPIIDALEEALKLDTMGDDLAGKIKDGVKQCLDMMIKVFEKQGIKQVQTDGKFDHNIHSAINQIEDQSKESGDIAQVYQKGYLYKDRVLRPAMVVVVK